MNATVLSVAYKKVLNNVSVSASKVSVLVSDPKTKRLCLRKMWEGLVSDDKPDVSVSSWTSRSRLHPCPCSVPGVSHNMQLNSGYIPTVSILVGIYLPIETRYVYDYHTGPHTGRTGYTQYLTIEQPKP
jgi:hypothetical protein